MLGNGLLLWSAKVAMAVAAVGSVGVGVVVAQKAQERPKRPPAVSLPTPVANDSGPFRIGQGSGIEPVWMLAYRRPPVSEYGSPDESLGQPVNAAHRWGPGCIQNFAKNGKETGALMALDCGSDVNVVSGERWQHLQAKYGNQAAFVIGYPLNDWHKWELPSGGHILVQDFVGGSRGKNQLHIGYTEGGPNVHFNIYGKILERYLELGGPDGPLDTLSSDQYFWNSLIRLDFKNGTLVWDPKIGVVRDLDQVQLPGVGAGAKEHRAVAWAMSQIGQTKQPDGKPWNGWCDRFVANAYGKTNSGYHTAYQHWQKLESRGLVHPGDRNAPYGALAFFGPTKVYPEGHVQISIGNGQFVSTGPKISEVSLMQANTYLGWANADPEWPGRK